MGKTPEMSGPDRRSTALSCSALATSSAEVVLADGQPVQVTRFKITDVAA
jgi:hypothetical protein